MDSQSWFLVEFAIIAVTTLVVMAGVYYAARWATRRYGRGNGE